MEIKLIEVIRCTKFECYLGEEVMGTAIRKYTACDYIRVPELGAPLKPHITASTV